MQSHVQPSNAEDTVATGLDQRRKDRADAVLSLRAVRKSFNGHPVIHSAGFYIGEGEVMALLGANGAGKTTIASIVAGLVAPDQGEITVAGIDAVKSPDEARRNIGFAPQELCIYPSLAVSENLGLAASVAGLRRRERQRRVRRVAEGCQLEGLLGQRAGLMSGGQQRRLHIAMSVVNSPRLILLDEPTVGVDIESRNAMIELVRDLANEGCAVLYTTHYLHEVEALNAMVAILAGGRIVDRGPISTLVERHGRSYAELSFDGGDIGLAGISEEFHTRWTVEIDGATLRAFSPRPAVDLSDMLSGIGPAAERITDIRIQLATLESVYLTVMAKYGGEAAS